MRSQPNEELVERAGAVPLNELLRRIPRDTILRWQEPDGLQAHCSSPIGLHAHEAATLIEQLSNRVERLERDVIAFLGPWAAKYADEHGLPRGHLHPVHYDLLKDCGARMDDFTRAALTGEPSLPGGLS